MDNINDGVLIDRLDFGGGYYYIGEVKDGVANGKGACYNPDGTLSRKGTFKNGELDGYGEIYVDGEKIYDGNFVNGERSGKGAQYIKGILQYEGDFQHDMRHGKGTQWWLDGSKYVGEFINNKRIGKGTLFVDNKKRYEGDFVDGKFHGHGILYDEFGNVAREGTFENGMIPYEKAHLKGNKWVSISHENVRTIAKSYIVAFNLAPRIEGIKDTLELFVQYVDNTAEKVTALGIYAHYISKGTGFALGGHPAGLKNGLMTIKMNGGDCMTIKPIELSTEIDKNGNIGVEETVVYHIEKELLKRVCDSENVSIQLTGDFDNWNEVLSGEQLTCLLRASWNGIFDENEYSTYIQNSSIAKKNKRAVIVNSCIWFGLGIITYLACEDAGEYNKGIIYALLLAGVGLYCLLKGKPGIAKHFFK